MDPAAGLAAMQASMQTLSIAGARTMRVSRVEQQRRPTQRALASPTITLMHACTPGFAYARVYVAASTRVMLMHACMPWLACARVYVAASYVCQHKECDSKGT